MPLSCVLPPMLPPPSLFPSPYPKQVFLLVSLWMLIRCTQVCVLNSGRSTPHPAQNSMEVRPNQHLKSLLWCFFLSAVFLLILVRRACPVYKALLAQCRYHQVPHGCLTMEISVQAAFVLCGPGVLRGKGVKNPQLIIFLLSLSFPGGFLNIQMVAHIVE